MSRTGKDMDRWLGDGGMPVIDLVGGAFTAGVGFHAMLAEINISGQFAHKIDVHVA